AVDYDPEHLREFTILADTVTSVETALTTITTGSFSLNKIKLGIWDEGTFRGGIDLMPQAGGRAEIGYWVGKEHVGQAYASRAARLLAHWTFRQLHGFDTVYAKIHHQNIASQRAIAKA